MSSIEEYRQELVGRVVEALHEVHAIGDPDQLADYANAAIEVLETAAEPVLFMHGHARRVDVADRFGPASWEISTEYYPGDQERWNQT